MIRILLVDDHPALRAGLHTVIRSEPGLVPVGAAAGEADLWPLLKRTRPDVVLLDYHLAGADGFILCHRIKGMMPPPRVLIYSAYANASLTVPAIVAGADGVINKGAPANELFDSIRAVARDKRVLPPVDSGLFDEARGRVDSADVALLDALMDECDRTSKLDALGLAPEGVSERVERILERLVVSVPGSEEVSIPTDPQ